MISELLYYIIDVIIERKKEYLLFMKKVKYKDLLIHSLELKIFLLELESNLSKLKIENTKDPGET